MKAFESAIAAIRTGCSTRVFLMSCDDSDFGKWESDAKAGVAEAQWLMGDCYLEGIAGRFDDKAARAAWGSPDNSSAWETSRTLFSIKSVILMGMMAAIICLMAASSGHFSYMLQVGFSLLFFCHKCLYVCMKMTELNAK